MTTRKTKPRLRLERWASMRPLLAGLCLSACCLMPFIGRAQWMTQRISLVPGWNAVHLKVNPADKSCAAVFNDSRITQIAWWNRDRLDDGTGSAVTDFCYWYRDGSTPSTFGRVIGDHRYLVYSTANIPYLDIQGTPAVPAGTIYLGEANLVGVNVPNQAGANAPTYYEYFKPLTEVVRSPSYYSVTADNTSLLIRNTVKASNASAAVWLQTAGEGIATYTGPFTVTLGDAAETLSWTDDASRARTLTVKNVSSQERVLKIERKASNPPPGGHGTLAGTDSGNAALLCETIDWSGGFANRVYVPFLNSSKTSFTTNIAAGATIELRLKPDTTRMAPSAGNYMSILEISDKGTTIDDEVRADGTCLYRVGVFASGALAAEQLRAKAGLWIGTVSLAQVNRAKTLSSAEPDWGADNLFTAPHQFQFRLLVHVDESGNAKILKEVFTAMDESGGDTYLLGDSLTAYAFRGQFPKGVIKRTSSANFPFIDPLPLTGGEFMVADTTISATFTQDYDDKTNPFVHSFHPQHDNLTFNNQKPSKLGDSADGTGEYESWAVTRTISLTFAAADPIAGNVEWNRTVTGGIYEETIDGLIGDGKPIKTRGAFRLTKVNDVSRILTGGFLN